MPQYAYYHQQYMPLTEAKIGVMTNFMHYGTGVFEASAAIGIRKRSKSTFSV